ncbi:MAG: sodium:dicarboxylate symporter [Cycloclasticus sp. symbiont of Poecilosclerida sp. M]|nr:MAG: sodium:dicarboxylate symporter [Cycloclasticus sp. symbiont of Poecilosclerida sp. M]
MANLKQLSLFLGPIFALLVFLSLQQSSLASSICITAAVAVWCVTWWIFEPVPIPITSLLPIAIFPLAGVLTGEQVAAAYGNKLVLLLLGGFLLSTAIAHCGAHRRLALTMVHWFGSDNPKRLVLGFMVACAVLSMWISNTAATLMLLPVALAVIDSADNKKLGLPLLLGLAYAASVGGISTPIGTPPNLVFMQVYEENTGLQISFTQWMGWAIPLVIVFIPIIWLWLTRKLENTGHCHLPKIGAWSTHEARVMVIFGLTALLWITRREPFGGWSGWLDLPQANDASVALLAVIALFVIPNGNKTELTGQKSGSMKLMPRGYKAEATQKLLDWKTAKQIPWGILLLFSGGICLAKAFVASGLSTQLGEQLSAVTALSIIGMMAVIALCVTFMTEATSNTATTAMLMPVLAATAINADIDPLLLMIPATFSASCAFMLPVATPPNTIVFSSGHVHSNQMAREGFVLNLIGAVIVTAICWMLLAS